MARDQYKALSQKEKKQKMRVYQKSISECVLIKTRNNKRVLLKMQTKYVLRRKRKKRNNR